MGARAIKKSIYSVVSIALAGIFFLGTSGHVQAQVAVDDSYGVPFGEPLVVENPGVLDNDTGDAVAAVLITPPLNGTLECVGGDDPALCDDGSFTYTPGSDFTGSDTFTYVTNDGAGGPDSTEVTVNLTACTGGPQIFSCWEEAAYLAKLGELGYGTFQEGFENDLIWGSVREPGAALSVTSKGIQWKTNHSDPPAANEITTGMGPARTGLWGIYDSDHGYATGVPAGCDIDNPPESCLYYDGFTGIRQAGLSALHGAGGFITGFAGANIALVLDGDVNNQIGLGKLSGTGHQFFGVIDAGVSGFTEFEFRELDGKVGQIRIIFGDDFTLATLCDEATDLCDVPTTSTTSTALITTTSSVPATSSALSSTTTILSPSSTTITTGAPCLSEVLYGDYSEETEILRYLRDNVLNQTPLGREIIRVYYQWNPVIVKAIENDKEFEKEVREVIDELLLLLEFKK
jgi:hypothetical protein